MTNTRRNDLEQEQPGVASQPVQFLNSACAVQVIEVKSMTPE